MSNMIRKHVLFIATITFSLSALVSSAHAGKVYKWTDENGVVHYGDMRPDDVQSETLKVAPKSSAPRTSPQEQLKALEEQKERSRQAKNEEDKEEARKQQNQQRCEQAKNNLQTMENNARIRIEENGELRYLTPEEISNKKDEMNKIIEEACSAE